MTPTLGQLVQSFFADHLVVQKGLRLGSIRSYRDTMRLFLRFMAEQTRRPIARLALEDLTLDRGLSFLKHLEQDRGNHARTRNQRRAPSTPFLPISLCACRRCSPLASKSPRFR